LVLDVLGKLVKRVTIEREQTVGNIGIVVEIDPIAFIFAEPQLTDMALPVVLREEIRSEWRYVSGGKSRAALERLADSRQYALTDEQYQLLEPALPDMTELHGKIRYVMETRRVADAAIFMARTGVGASNLPAAFGNTKMLPNLIRRFIYIGGFATIVRVMAALDPDWAKGLNESMLNLKKTAFDSSRSWALLRPGLSAAECAESKRYRLTDEQWDAVKHLFDPRVLQPRGAPPRPFTSRQLLDGIFIKLRTLTGWNNMPAEFGGKNHLRGGATSLARTGSWQEIMSVFAKHFPEVVEDLDDHAVKALAEGRQAALKQDIELRSVQRETLAKVLGNFELHVAGGAKERGCVVRMGAVSVPLPGRRHMLPSLAIGPRASVHRKMVKRPMLVLRATDTRFWKTDRAQALMYREAEGISHVILLALDRRRVEHFRKTGGIWRSDELTGSQALLDLPEFSCCISLEAIYGDASVF
jgi:transposase